MSSTRSGRKNPKTPSHWRATYLPHPHPGRGSQCLLGSRENEGSNSVTSTGKLPYKGATTPPGGKTKKRLEQLNFEVGRKTEKNKIIRAH